MIATQEAAVSAVRFAADVLTRCVCTKHDLTPDEVLKIRAIHAAGGISEMRIGLMFGITQPRVSDIVRGKTYKHVA